MHFANAIFMTSFNSGLKSIDCDGFSSTDISRYLLTASQLIEINLNMEALQRPAAHPEAGFHSVCKMSFFFPMHLFHKRLE